MIKLYLTGIFFSTFQLTYCQNLIPNPSFEEVNAIVPNWSGTFSKFNRWIKGWNSPTQGSPDILFTKTLDRMFPKRPKVDLTKHQPRTGKFMVGIKTFGCESNTLHCKEYLQIQLKHPLVQGHKYYVEFWVSPIETSVKVNSFGIALNYDKVQDLTVKGLLDIYPVFSSEKIVQSDSIEWHKISHVFEAEDNFEFVIIGNFGPDRAMEFQMEENGLDYGYYLIDDILLKPLLDKTPAKFVPNETIILENILFEYDQAIIIESSYTQLDQLVQHLKLNANLLIEIRGHTDAKGNSKYNLELSQKRADEIKSYLVLKGIDHSRINTIGLGSQFPIADNNSEENRQLNRRVEIKLIEN